MKINHLDSLGPRAILVGGGALALTGCFGSFGATTSPWKWNDDFGNEWVKWLVFLGLNILPVYSLFVLADVHVAVQAELGAQASQIARVRDDWAPSSLL